MALLDYDKLDPMERLRVSRAFDAAYMKAGPVTPAQADAMNHYSGSGSVIINHLMRNRDQIGEYGAADVQAAAQANALLERARKSPLPQTTRLYRGVAWDDRSSSPFAQGLEVGMEWKEDSFVSTSMLMDGADEFSEGNDLWTGEGTTRRAMLHMIAPRNIPSLQLNMDGAGSVERHEEEILLHPSSWRVDKIVRRDGVDHVLCQCTGLVAAPDLEVVREPISRSGGYQRSFAQPVYFNSQVDHGLGQSFERKAGEKPGYLAGLPERVEGAQQSTEFIAEGDDLTLGSHDDWLVQDPQSGAVTALGPEFTRAYQPAAYEQSHSL